MHISYIDLCIYIYIHEYTYIYTRTVFNYKYMYTYVLSCYMYVYMYFSLYVVCVDIYSCAHTVVDRQRGQRILLAWRSR